MVISFQPQTQSRVCLRLFCAVLQMVYVIISCVEELVLMRCEGAAPTRGMLAHMSKPLITRPIELIGTATIFCKADIWLQIILNMVLLSSLVDAVRTSPDIRWFEPPYLLIFHFLNR